MQANVENFVLLDMERYYPAAQGVRPVEDEKELPSRHDSVESAFADLEILGDVDDDMVFIGIAPEDYMRTWNRTTERKRKRLCYYDDNDDPENLRIE